MILMIVQMHVRISIVIFSIISMSLSETAANTPPLTPNIFSQSVMSFMGSKRWPPVKGATVFNNNN